MTVSMLAGHSLNCESTFEASSLTLGVLALKHRCSTGSIPPSLFNMGPYLWAAWIDRVNVLGMDLDAWGLTKSMYWIDNDHKCSSM